MPLFAKHIVEHHRARLEVEVALDAEFGFAFFNETAQFARSADAREVALHVRHEARHSSLAECLGHDLKGNRFACASGASHQAVSVGHLANDAYGAIGAVGYVESVVLSVHLILMCLFSFFFF